MNTSPCCRLPRMLAILACAGSLFLAGAARADLSFTAEYTLSVANSGRQPTDTTSKALHGSLSMMGGGVDAGTLTDQVSIGPVRYHISSHSNASAVLRTLLPSTALSRSSDGRVGGGYPASDRFVEKRGNKDAITVVIDYAKRKAVYWRGKELRKQEAVQFRVADAASLPYVFFRQPPARGAVTVAATDGLSTRYFVLDPHEDSVTVDGHAIPATRWTRRITHAGDAGLELWVRKSDGFPLRLRLGLSDKYGLVLNQQLARLPTFTGH